MRFYVSVGEKKGCGLNTLLLALADKPLPSICSALSYLRTLSIKKTKLRFGGVEFFNFMEFGSGLESQRAQIICNKTQRSFELNGIWREPLSWQNEPQGYGYVADQALPQAGRYCDSLGKLKWSVGYFLMLVLDFLKSAAGVDFLSQAFQDEKYAVVYTCCLGWWGATQAPEGGSGRCCRPSPSSRASPFPHSLWRNLHSLTSEPSLWRARNGLAESILPWITESGIHLTWL